MNFNDDDLVGPLNAMLMPARWNGLRKNEVNRVIGGLIYPTIFKYSPKWYLEKITELLSSKDDLSSLIPDRHPSETDQNIREFLFDLAMEIEKTFPTVARSGQHVTISGEWIGVDCNELLGHLNEGDKLPCVNGRMVVWERKNEVATSAEQVVLHEFTFYYTRKSIGNRVLYMKPEELATYSIRRLVNNEFNEFEPSIRNLLLAMSNDRLHPLTKEIERITKQDWTDDDENWKWYRGLLIAIRNGMAEWPV